MRAIRHSPPAPQPRAKVGSVLIVDPDPDTRLLYRTALEPVGAAITEAEDGAEAFGKAVCDPPAVVVMETRLPRLDGLALCTSLRRDPVTAHIHIILATAAASADLEVQAAAAGADAVFLKPYAIEQLVAGVQSALLHAIERMTS